jgi:hypothetical protein
MLFCRVRRALQALLSYFNPNPNDGKHHRLIVGQIYGTLNLIISGISLALAVWYKKRLQLP